MLQQLQLPPGVSSSMLEPTLLQRQGCSSSTAGSSWCGSCTHVGESAMFRVLVMF
jgi:hypothetical protein